MLGAQTNQFSNHDSKYLGEDLKSIRKTTEVLVEKLIVQIHKPNFGALHAMMPCNTFFCVGSA